MTNSPRRPLLIDPTLDGATLNGEGKGTTSPVSRPGSNFLEIPGDPSLSKKSSRSKMRAITNAETIKPVQLRILIVEVKSTLYTGYHRFMLFTGQRYQSHYSC